MNLEALRLFCEEDDSNEFTPLRPHPHLGLGDAPGIVVPHRHWLSAQAWDMVCVGRALKCADSVRFTVQRTTDRGRVRLVARYRLTARLTPKHFI